MGGREVVDGVPNVLLEGWNNDMLSGEEWDAIILLTAERDRYKYIVDVLIEKGILAEVDGEIGIIRTSRVIDKELK